MKSFKGFTLIELLVVVAIIGILAVIVINSLGQARMRARDARRQADMRSILTALNMYYLDNDTLPTTDMYGQLNAGGWDYSSQGGSFMTFLSSGNYLSLVPVDPINNMTGDALPSGAFSYRYFCYTSGPNLGLHLGYWSESTQNYVNAATSDGSWTDTDFLCG